MNTYESFKDLQQHALEGRDFSVEMVIGTTGYAIMAPHGGGIEPGTDIIAKAIAGNDHSYYAFKGLRPHNNFVLHLDSVRFDEPRALELVRRSHSVVSIHGCRTIESAVYVGGLNSSLKDKIMDALRHSGFQAGNSPNSGLGGVHRQNLCNRGSRGRGIQLEISGPLRRQLMGSEEWRYPRANALLNAFASAIRGVLTEP